MPSIRPRHALIGTVVYTIIMVAALVIPASPPHAQRGYLRDIPLGRRLVADVALNVAIFVPIGWGVRRAGSTSLLAAVVLTAAFSLGMETIQAWLPNRYSSLADVLANTLGATAGAWLESRYAHRR